MKLFVVFGRMKVIQVWYNMRVNDFRLITVITDVHFLGNASLRVTWGCLCVCAYLFCELVHPYRVNKPTDITDAKWKLLLLVGLEMAFHHCWVALLHLSSFEPYFYCLCLYIALFYLINIISNFTCTLMYNVSTGEQKWS